MNLCIYISMYIYIYKCIHIYTHTYIYIYIHMYVSVYIHTYICIYMYMYIYIYICIYIICSMHWHCSFAISALPTHASFAKEAWAHICTQVWGALIYMMYIHILTVAISCGVALVCMSYRIPFCKGMLDVSCELMGAIRSDVHIYAHTYIFTHIHIFVTKYPFKISSYIYW